MIRRVLLDLLAIALLIVLMGIVGTWDYEDQCRAPGAHCEVQP